MNNQERHPCFDGISDLDHDPEWISDWYGDPTIPNGTADCSRWECKRCGEILGGDPPDPPEDDREYEREPFDIL